MAEKYFVQPSATGAQKHFAEVPSADIQRSKFDRSHGYKTTFDAGKLIPIYVDEILPGDTFKMKSTAFARFATPLKPIMDNIYLDTHYFFVPYRLVWDNWQYFCGEGELVGETLGDYEIPTTTITLNPANQDSPRIADYFGIPRNLDTSGNTTISALPFRAYTLIWNEWYREENVVAKKAVATDDGPDSWGGIEVYDRMKRHDYFTSCLPWPQKGDPVNIPLGTTAPVVTNNNEPLVYGASSGDQRNLEFNVISGAKSIGYTGANDASATTMKWGNETGMVTDLTSATAVTINELRTAFQVQRMLERDARGGTRYIELILSHFGVRSPDARLQRPEYLGGGTSMVNINPVASTVSDIEAPQGNLAGVGTSVNKAGFEKSFTEHGIIIGIVSARADLTYQNGTERFWYRKTRYDFYWPALAHLGEQAVLNREIYTNGTTGDPTKPDDFAVFGYQERYAEYRYKPSRITGKFKSNDDTSLDYWHLSQDFETPPALNLQFMAENPPIDRVIAVPSEPQFLLDMWFNLKCDRPMPVYSVPGLIDHF